MTETSEYGLLLKITDKIYTFFIVAMVFPGSGCFRVALFDALFPNSLCRIRIFISQCGLASSTKQVYGIEYEMQSSE